MEYITTATFSVLVNEISDDFLNQVEGSDRGAPYHLIFLLFLQNISEDIYHQAIIPKPGIGIKVAKDGLTILYLMFADCIIF